MNFTITLELEGTAIHDLPWDEVMALCNKLNEMPGYTEVLSKPIPLVAPPPMTDPKWVPWCGTAGDSVPPQHITNSIIPKT